MQKKEKEKFKNMSIDILKKEVSLIRKEILTNKIKVFSNANKNVHLVKNLKRKLACCLTFLHQKVILNEK